MIMKLKLFEGFDSYVYISLEMRKKIKNGDNGKLAPVGIIPSNQTSSFSSRTKIRTDSWIRRKKEKKNTTQPRWDSNLGLPFVGGRSLIYRR